ncbi:hypothetical protein LRS06_24335 [Hymenobacter sp. J193]|uniref:hypothetical protein n=1 Tax=Hymenobacter sp. J193 TaxID=2898429 RepID=UPI0021512508|nr:hypothetical protein [Hymenobacter sp. J193]MCR5890858.1 hypothetical protein [Hymenobacter sp. J193]
MSSQPPRAAPNTQNVGLIFALLLLAIIGGEYYTLLHRDEIAQARAVQLTQPEIKALTPKEKTRRPDCRHQ